MATTYLSSIVGGAVDPRKEGLPCFAMYGGDYGSYFNLKIIDSDFNYVGNPWASVGYTAGIRYGMSINPLIVPNYTLTTQAVTSNDYFAQSVHNTDQYPQSGYCSTSCSGYWVNVNINDTASWKMYQGYQLINQVMPEGMRPRRYFGMNGNNFIEFPSLNRMNSYCDSFDLTTKKISRTMAVGNGTAGYNERTKTLVTIHGDGTTAACVATKFVSTVNLNTCKNLAEFFSNATVTEYSITCGTSEGLTDKTIVVGDNNWIGVSWRNGIQFLAFSYDLSGTNLPSITFTALNLTTSYGILNGNTYYTKMNLTWDGMWAIAFTPYHYYGNGLGAYIFSTADPRRCFRILNTNSSGGGLVYPFGKSGFVYMSGESFVSSNTPRYSSWDFKNTDPTNYTVATSYTHSSGTGNVSVTNDSLLNAATVNSSLVGIYVNNIPYYTSVNYWALNGKTRYEGGFL